MEIKSKLFTVIAQALDKLKKQFDNTNKSLAKTQTTLDATIINIDNVVDSVAKTMTEALDPYFVDMIYGYIDANGKFKLGVIKDPWKDGINNVIPSNIVYIYHWGDTEMFKTIASYVTLFKDCKQSKVDIDFTTLFPNVNIASNQMLAYSSTFNKVILNGSMLLYKGKYGNGLVDYSTINHLIIIDEPDVYKSSDVLVRSGHIEHLELRNVKKLLKDASDLGCLISNCSFGFEKTTDIIGWDNIEYYESLNISEYGDSGTSGKNKLNTFIMNHPIIINILNNEYWIEEAYLDGYLNNVDNTNKFSFRAFNCKKLYIYLHSYLAFRNDNRILDVHGDCEVYIADNSYGEPDYRKTSKDYILDLSGENKFYTNTFTPIFKVGQVIFSSVSHISQHALNFGFIKSIKFYTIDGLNSFISAASKSKYIWRFFERNEIENNSIEIFIDESTISHIDIGSTIISSSLFSKFKIESVNCNNATAIYPCAFEGSGLKHIDLGIVTHIYSSAFANTPLEYIDLSNIIHIGDWAFENTNIKELIIPDNYGESDLPIGIAHGCNLNLMVIPAVITESDSEDNAFDSCKKLYIKGDRVLNIEDNFGRADVVYVPNSVLNRYKTHSYWKNQADKIFPYDFELNPDNI